MAVEFLVRTSSRKIYQKGAISQTVKESPCVWGSKERLPDYLIFRITDATKEDIEKYNQQWCERFEVLDSPSAWIIKRADEGRINRINLSSEKIERVKQELQALGVRRSDVSLEDGDILIAKVITKEQVQGIVSDFCEAFHKHRMFHVKSSVIDTLVSKGEDVVEGTLAQFEKHLVDGRD